MPEVVDNTRNDSLVVGTTSTLLSRRPKGQKRISIVVRNISTAAQRVTIHMGDLKAEVNQGLVLEAGDVFTDNSVSDNILAFQGQYSAISSAAAALLAVQERIE